MNNNYFFIIVPAILLSFLTYAQCQTPTDEKSNNSLHEGAVVLSSPDNNKDLVAGDIIILLNNSPCPSIADCRKQIFHSLEKSIRITVIRNEKKHSIQAKLTNGIYHLDRYPNPADYFRRRYSNSQKTPEAISGGKALEAIHKKKYRSADRYLQHAITANDNDPLLKWVESWLNIHLHHSIHDAESLTKSAIKTAKVHPAPYRDYVLGKLYLNLSWIYLERHQIEKAKAQIILAKEKHEDVSPVLFHFGKKFIDQPKFQVEGQKFLVHAVEENPFLLHAIEILTIKSSPTPLRKKYLAHAQVLSGTTKNRKPSIQLEKFIQETNSNPAKRQQLVDFLADPQNISAEEKNKAYIAIAESFEKQDKASMGLPFRIKALKAFPVFAQAKEIAAVSRKEKKYAEVLCALREIYEEDILDYPNVRPYLKLWRDLDKEFFPVTGVPVLEKAISLHKAGQTEKAIDYLKSQAMRTGHRGFFTTAGMLLAESGKVGEAAELFRFSYAYWHSFVVGQENWWDSFEYCRLFAQTGYPPYTNTVYKRYLKTNLAVSRAIRAGMYFKENKRKEAVLELRLAAKKLDEKQDGKHWRPIYMEGMYCKTVKDYIDVLNQKLNAKVDLQPKKKKKAKAQKPKKKKTKKNEETEDELF